MLVLEGRKWKKVEASYLAYTLSYLSQEGNYLCPIVNHSETFGTISQMARLYPSGVVNSIIERLHSEAVRQIGVTDELSELKNTISSIKAVLPDAEEKQRDTNAVKLWLEKLEDEVYEADELVDELSYEALRQQRARMLGRDSITKKVCTFFSTSLNQVALHDKLGNKIIAINKRLAAIRDDKDISLKKRHEKNIVFTGGKERTRSCVHEDSVIAMGSDKMEILQFLLDATKSKEENVQVTAIVGEGGIGKTTLAKLAYNDEEVVKHFDLRSWVNLSDTFTFDERLVIRKVVKSATNKDFENLETYQLKQKLGKIVRGKRCLLVLDDLLHGGDLKPLLLGCKYGSRVIITSRFPEVASTMVTMPPYKLQMLTAEKSYYLFEEMGFMNREKPINSAIRTIVNICSGHPFLIRTIGRMFYSKSPNMEQSSLLEMIKCRMRFARDDYVFTGLKIAYENLPSHLKQCLAYCSVFPKGFEINVETLINLWMAQGFIYSSPRKHILEDVGYEYFQYLYWLCFFEEVEKDEKGIARKCRMSSLMHDVAIYAAGPISVRLSERQSGGISRRETQHVSFNFHLDSSSQVPTSLVEANRIRTILLNNQMLLETEGTQSQSICDKIVSNCKLLRVLDLHNTGIEMVPVSIGMLKHLRYLDVSHNTAIKALPNSITMLLHLTVLKLSSCYGLQELPRDIQKLVSLTHLEIDWCYSLTHLPRGLGHLTQLQTLSEFVLNKGNRNSCSLSELAGLNNLRGKLKIKNLENGIYDSKAAILKEKEHLTSLTLAWDSDVHNKDTAKDQLDCLEPPSNIKELALVRYEGIEFSNWLSSLNNLVKFSLRNCKCQHLPPLSQLSSLKVLMLDQMTDLKYISNEYGNGHSSSSSSAAAFFRSLEELRLTELPKLEGWWGGDNSLATESSLPSFPRLSKLMIEDCPKLSSMPLYTHLKEWLVLDNTSLETFQHTMKASRSSQVPSETNKEWLAASTSSAVSASSSLSRLQSLCIIGIKKLEVSNSDEIKWEGLRNLRFLRFDYLPKLKKLPEGLQHVTTLQELHIWRCNMETLPEWIGNFKMLTILGISVCPYLNSLPEAIKSLSSLITLEIVDCPILLERCKSKTGADWHKIEHIPDLLLQRPQSSFSSSSSRN